MDGDTVGTIVRNSVGLNVGSIEGVKVEERVGATVLTVVGLTVGSKEGNSVGVKVVVAVGSNNGTMVGIAVGLSDGSAEGELDEGKMEGKHVFSIDGVTVGSMVGSFKVIKESTKHIKTSKIRIEFKIIMSIIRRRFLSIHSQ